ncbi:MAG: ABC transporter permease [Actinomycetota bacterium]|nr:ABC transporter permease [Actinomycetota bacterium]
MSVIAHNRRVFQLPSLRWLTRHTELLRTLLRRELRARYKGSALGAFWTLLYPLVMMGVYTLVFSELWRAVDVPHYPLFFLSAFAVWAFFQSSIQVGAASLPANGQLIKKVWFPRELVPTAVVLTQAVTTLVMLAVLVPVFLVVVPETARTMLLAVPLLAALFCLTLGLTWLIATANVFFRDVEHLIGVLFLPWFFLTPVLYSLEHLPAAGEHAWLVTILRYGNPVTPYVESIRGALLQGEVAGAGMLAYTFIVGPAIALLGLWVIQRYEDQFAVEL